MTQPASPSMRSYFTGSPAFVVLFLVMFSGTAGMGIVSPLLPLFAKEMGASGIWLGLAFSGFAISQTPLMPVFGRLSDRRGRRPFIAAGLAVYGLSAVGMLLAPNFYVLVAMRFFAGVGAAMLFPVATAYAGDLSPVGREGAFMGVFTLSIQAGWGIGPLIGGVLSDAFGKDAAFAAQATLAFFAVMIVLTRLPEPKRRTEEELGASLSMWRMLRLRPVQALAFFQLVSAFNNGVILSFLAVYLTDSLGAAAALVGAILSTRVVMNGLLQPAGGMLADRWSRMAMMSAGMLLAGATTLAIPAFGTLGLVWAMFAVLGIVESLGMPAASAMAVDIGRPLGMGTLMGVFNTAMSAGLVIGSLAGGVVVDALGAASAFRMSGTVVMVGAVALILMTSRGRSGVAPAPVPVGPVGEA